MPLLLTRPAEDSERTRLALEAMGHAVLASPVIAFEPTGEPWPRRPPEGLIATSARAFSEAEDEGYDAEVRRDLPLFLVGRRTEEAARRHGFMGPASVAADGAALVASLLDRRPMRLLYLAGAERKSVIEDGLAASRHRLMVIETYEAVAADALTREAVTALGDGRIDAVLHYSRRSAAIFLDLCDAARLDPKPLRHLCLSADVAAPLRAARCDKIAIAATPDERALFALV